MKIGDRDISMHPAPDRFESNGSAEPFGRRAVRLAPLRFAGLFSRRGTGVCGEAPFASEGAKRRSAVGFSFLFFTWTFGFIMALVHGRAWNH